MGNNNRTIIHFLQALESIAEYQGIDLKIKRPKLTVKVPDYLNAVECRALLDAANNRRDKALIAVLLYCGLRNKEICSLDLEDIEIKNRILWIRDRGQGIKNRHERKAILSKEAVKLLNDWLMIRPRIEDNNALFVTLYGDRFRTERLDRSIRDTAKRAGINKRVYPHLLRHSCATNMIKSGIPITEVMLQLGHRSLSSTMIYLHGNIDDLKNNVDKKFTF
jgi:integrase/recombinase XerD